MLILQTRAINLTLQYLQLLEFRAVYLRECFLEEVPLLLAANSGEDFTAHVESDGDGSLSHPACTRVHQQTLSGFHPASHHQSVVALSTQQTLNAVDY